MRESVDAGIAEDEIRGSEFFEPEAGLAARIPQLIVRCQDLRIFMCVLLGEELGPGFAMISERI